VSEIKYRVSNNEAESQFEWTDGGEVAVLTYRLEPGSIVFVHTGVPEKLQDHGVAGELAAAGLEFARQKRWTVVPLCPFVAAYVKRHPEYLDLVRT
jgi:uncharacterized protein